MPPDPYETESQNPIPNRLNRNNAAAIRLVTLLAEMAAARTMRDDDADEPTYEKTESGRNDLDSVPKTPK